ncbi:MAG: 2,4-diaminopentanoate dehydrogenase [Candidatus Ozemobacter sibiricus]|jgi:4-hydroxy-tetrahydrodipicolinate reductase|uniref:2,4-diaminopentanoate dehydrogenase n=1 Tax=Candidatus Ozemobacter sibiricus TaxID=2268124 RepID=A0A367ZJN5_9BACT|nr:MAG: 2,4-diaminopentanoate dehydrogenase [Candidatus Ozemobacter sibiricus]
MKPIRVVQWGLGAMGSGMCKLMLEKEGLKIVGAIRKRPDTVGKDLGEVLGLKKELGVKVTNKPSDVLKKDNVDIVLHATDSFTRSCFDELKKIIEAGIDCISIAEEMAYPHAQEPDLAKEIDLLAKRHDVTVLGTGVNPGFVLDALIIMLSGACLRVDRIEASRINDLSPFGATVMKTQGVGTTPEEFEAGLKAGTIVGHIGFPESIKMISDALGLGVDRIEQQRRPIISKTHRETPVVKVTPGMVAGCEHIGIGYRGNKEVIKLVHPQQIHPEKEDIMTGDYINIYGDPDIKMCNKPEIPGGKGTIAVAVNMIPIVKKATPGFKRMIDLPIPACLMGPSAYDRWM